MKNKKYQIKATPIVPALCGIGMAILWYLFFYVVDGEWTFDFNTVSFGEMTGTQIAFTVLTLLIPITFFIAVLFLAEWDLRWVTVALLFPIANQIFLFVNYLMEDYPDYVFENPLQFAVPFLALILFVLTVEKVIPVKWVLVGFCGLAILLPLVLTLCGVGEFASSQALYDENYQPVIVTARLWSDYLTFALYYLGLGALAWQMKEPAEEPERSAEAEEPAEDAEESVEPEVPSEEARDEEGK